MPAQISQEVESRIAAEESRRAAVEEKTRGGPEAIRRIMRQSTRDGTLTLEGLSAELEKEGYVEPSAEQVIGQAELEGILVRASPDSWSWL